MELIDSGDGNSQCNSIAIGSRFEVVIKRKLANRSDFELIGKLRFDLMKIENEFELLEREEGWFVGIRKGLVPLLKGRSIDDMIRDTVAIEF